MNEAYRAEADALDAEILAAIATRLVPDFNDLALRIFAHQLRYNEPYARYCTSLGVSLESMPRSWDIIPPIPAGAFKEAALCTFDPARAGLTFETSGTTAGTGGRHYMESSLLYDAALSAGFCDRFGGTGSHFLLLVPDPALQPASSLGYMMKRAASQFGCGEPRWYIREHGVDADAFARDVRALPAGEPAFVAATAFALVALLDSVDGAGRDVRLPPGSCVMETGGFKGRVREIEPADLYRRLERTFAIGRESIVSEYGMTELSSQYYDVSEIAGRRIKRGPKWLRSYAVDESGERLPPGVVGALVHVDLASRSSCIAIQTEDLGAVLADGGLALIGRERGAELRGCSLDAEPLRAAVS